MIYRNCADTPRSPPENPNLKHHTAYAKMSATDVVLGEATEDGEISDTEGVTETLNLNEEDTYSSLYVNTVEFTVPNSGKHVSVAVNKIIKVVQMYFDKRDGQHRYAIHTVDGHRTVVASRHGYKDFSDYVFDPKRLNRKLGKSATCKDDNLG